jgi:prepilin-type N-terminal cleavage/methylation domain-containing protein
MTPAHRPQRGPGRPAFTLIELLVVISIIAVLVALSAGVYYRFIGAQQTSNTRTALQAMHSRLDESWDAVTEKARKGPIPGKYKSTMLTLAGGDPQRAQVIWIKASQKQAFPMTFDEVFNPLPLAAPLVSLAPLPAYRTQLQQLGFNGSSAQTAPYESSVCLLMALKRRVSGAGIGSQDLGTYVKLFPLTNAAGQTVNVEGLADPYGNPVTFCRWPTGFAELVGPRVGFQDPADPQGYLTQANWLNNQSATFQAQLHTLPPRSASNQPQSYKLRPLIVSWGGEEDPPRLGMNPTTLAPDGTGGDNDNIFSIPIE